MKEYNQHFWLDRGRRQQIMSLYQRGYSVQTQSEMPWRASPWLERENEWPMTAGCDSEYSVSIASERTGSDPLWQRKQIPNWNNDEAKVPLVNAHSIGVHIVCPQNHISVLSACIVGHRTEKSSINCVVLWFLNPAILSSRCDTRGFNPSLLSWNSGTANRKRWNDRVWCFFLVGFSPEKINVRKKSKRKTM